MAVKIVDLLIKGYDRVIHAKDKVTKLDCVIAIHNTKLGPSLGGVRSWSYNSFSTSLNKCLFLFKSLIAIFAFLLVALLLT